MEVFPCKTVLLGDRSYELYGPSQDDPSFSNLSDNSEPEFTMICEYLLAEDSICLDIGANIGVMSVIMANCAQYGQVCAVEASPSMAKLLRMNVESNHVNNIIVEEKAIGDVEKSVRFVDAGCFGHVDDNNDLGIPVEMTTLTSLAKQKGLPRVDFIKMNIFGFECPALEVSGEFLHANNPLIFMEFNSWCQTVRMRTNPMQQLDWLLNNFSNAYAVSKGDQKILSPIEKENKEAFLWRNMQRDGFVTNLLLSNNPQHTAILKHLSQVDIRKYEIPRFFLGDYQQKTISQDDILSAYRMILGREPESAKVVEERIGTTTVEVLRNELLHSEEFQLNRY